MTIKVFDAADRGSRPVFVFVFVLNECLVYSVMS